MEADFTGLRPHLRRKAALPIRSSPRIHRSPSLMSSAFERLNAPLPTSQGDATLVSLMDGGRRPTIAREAAVEPLASDTEYGSAFDDSAEDSSGYLHYSDSSDSMFDAPQTVYPVVPFQPDKHHPASSPAPIHQEIITHHRHIDHSMLHEVPNKLLTN